MTVRTPTMIVADPDFPSLVAEMFAVPVDTPVAMPDPLTIATVGALLDHATDAAGDDTGGRDLRNTGRAARPGNGPASQLLTGFAQGLRRQRDSLADGDRWCGGVTTTLPTGMGVTVTCAAPVLPPLVAVMVALPTAIPLTSPEDDTVAMELSDDP